MNTLSLCMIVKNEELSLERCLNSAKIFCDEIIIVDTGSLDSTKTIAKNFTDKIYDYNWCNDFSKARNFAFSKATSKYVMWLDADDVVPKQTAEYIQNNKQNLCDDVYMFKYCTNFDKNNNPTFSFYRERIIKNCKNAFWQGAVHECIAPFGKIQKLDLPIYHKKIKPHDTSRNLLIYQNLIKLRPLTPREQYYYGRELFDHKKYTEAISVLSKFVKNKNAWTENVIDAYYVMSKCYNVLKNKNNELLCLLKTLTLTAPRANIACKIGDIFFTQKNYAIAKYWYTQATLCNNAEMLFGFVEPIYYNYYPFLQLSCCYYYLGDLTNAIKYNNKASYYLNTETTKNNKKFYKLIKNQKNAL